AAVEPPTTRRTTRRTSTCRRKKITPPRSYGHPPTPRSGFPTPTGRARTPRSLITPIWLSGTHTIASRVQPRLPSRPSALRTLLQLPGARLKAGARLGSVRAVARAVGSEPERPVG